MTRNHQKLIDGLERLDYLCWRQWWKKCFEINWPLACLKPRLFKGVLVLPWAMPSLLASVAPWRTIVKIIVLLCVAIITSMITNWNYVFLLLVSMNSTNSSKTADFKFLHTWSCLLDLPVGGVHQGFENMKINCSAINFDHISPLFPSLLVAAK